MRAPQLRIRLLFAMVTVALIASIFGGASWVADHRVVASLFGDGAPSEIAAQYDTAPVRLAADDLSVYRQYAAAALNDDAPLVLSFHDVGPHPKSVFAVTPERFDADLTMLAEAGFRSVTAGQVRRYLAGAPLPRRSLLITFDDGASGLWRYADPIMRRHGFHGVAFVITGNLSAQSTSYYLTWAELRRMHASGRWDVESHSDHGHDAVRADAAGNRGPFFVTREWKPRLHRLETRAEFRERIARDLRSSKRKIRTAGLPAPELFAHPFSPRARDANDPGNLAILADVVQRTFAADFINDDLARQLARGSSGPLPRLEVLGSATPRSLFDGVRRAMSIAPAALEPFTDPPLWVDDAGRKIRGAFAGDQLALPIGAGTFSRAHFAPGATSQWSAYEVKVRVEGLGTVASGGSGGIAVHEGSAAPFHVTVSAGRLNVRLGVEPDAPVLAEKRLFPASGHDLVIAVAGPWLTVTVDGRLAYRGTAALAPGASVPRGGLSLNVWRPGATVGSPVFYALRVAPIV